MTPRGDSGRTFPNIRDRNREGNRNCARWGWGQGVTQGIPKPPRNPNTPGWGGFTQFGMTGSVLGVNLSRLGEFSQFWGEFSQFWGEFVQFEVTRSSFWVSMPSFCVSTPSLE